MKKQEEMIDWLDMRPEMMELEVVKEMGLRDLDSRIIALETIDACLDEMFMVPSGIFTRGFLQRVRTAAVVQTSGPFP